MDSSSIIAIFFYSKYCKECPRIMNIIENPNDFIFVCVDNTNVRNKIIHDKKFLITHVPCLLIISNNTFEKYDNPNKIIDWLQKNELINQDDNNYESQEYENPTTSLQQEVITLPPLKKEEKNTLIPDNKVDGNSFLPSLNGQNYPSVKDETQSSNKEENTEENEELIKTSTKNSNVLSLAQQMQRERETDPPILK